MSRWRERLQAQQLQPQALPVSLGLRGSILAATGLNSIRSTPASITVLTFASALLTGTVVFAGMMTTRPSRR